jgi:hypothetical protein
VGADVAARLLVQGRLADRLQQELVLSRRPDVSIHGIPFLFHLARQRFPSADIEGAGLTVEGVRMRRVSLRVEDLRFSSRGGSIQASRGRGEVEVTEEALSDLLAAHGIPLTVALKPGSARVTAEAGGTEVSAAGTLRLRRGTLVFRPQEAAGLAVPSSLFAFRVPLPRVLAGVDYRSLGIGNGVAILEMDLAGSVLRVGS